MARARRKRVLRRGSRSPKTHSEGSAGAVKALVEMVLDRLLDAQAALSEASEDAEVLRWNTEEQSPDGVDIDATYLSNDIEEVRDGDLEEVIDEVRQMLEEFR